MDLKARVKKYASPGRSKDKANGEARTPKSDDENDSDKKSIFSTKTKSPVRIFLRDQLKRKSSVIGSPTSSPSGLKAKTNGFGTRKFSQNKPSVEASPLYENGAPAVPAKDNSLTVPTSNEALGEPRSPASFESSKIETAVAVKLEKVPTPQPSPEISTPEETTESPLNVKSPNGSATPPTDLMAPVSFPKRLSSLGQSGQNAKPVTITESLSEDEDPVEDRKDSAQDSDETSVQIDDAILSTEKEEEEEIEEVEPAGGIEVVLKREGKVDEVLVTAFLILLLVLIFYNPFFDVPSIKIWG